MKRVIALLAFIICGVIGTISAQTSQTTITMGGSTQSVTGCNFVIYDHGGLTGDYAANRNDLLTIRSSNSSAACVQISINMQDFDIHSSDTLFIYNGVTADDSLLLEAVNNSLLDGVTATNIIITATISNPTGALTLRFVSDADNNGSGFVITTSCVAPCQRVSLAIDSVESSHYPFLADDGFYYVDLCEYDTLHMVVHGIFPDNDFSYHQSDSTSTFTWDLGIETIEGVGKNTIDYYFETGRGYDIAISNVDNAGCANYMPQIFRIRTSQNPIRKVSQLAPMCTGDEITISSTYSNLSVIQVDSVYSEQLTTLKVTDTIFLPDGLDCGSGCAYSSSVTFTAFAPSATIRSADDILYVRIQMEHSWVGDIYIALTCPNGQTAKIMNKYSGSGSEDCADTIPRPWGWQVTTGYTTSADFGKADRTNDNSSNKCNPNLNPMGTPWNYCWSNNTDPRYNYQYANGRGYVYESVNHGHHNSGSIDSTNTVNMTQVYHPDDDFSTLVGCPMNGTWSIKVIDGWGGDNGWLTEWEMALDPALLPQDWDYTVHPDTLWVTGPGAVGNYIIPDSSGSIAYTAHVRDEFGCVYDTLLHIDVVERPHPDLGPDITVCQGEFYKLDCNYSHPSSTYLWNTGERTPSFYLASGGDYSVRVTVTNDDGLSCSGSDTVNVTISPKPIPQFSLSDTVGCAPLTIHTTNTSFANDTMPITFFWTIFDYGGSVVLTSDKTNPDFRLEKDGKYSIRLVATTAEGCIDSITKWNYVTVNYQPVAEFDALPDVSIWSETNGSILFQVQGDTLSFSNDMGFYWDFDHENGIDSSSYVLEHTFPSWGDYDVSLHMYTPEGCNSSITHTVSLEADLVFPNVITPNGDGVNDVFAIGNLNTSMNEYDPDKYRSNELTIYDRWGKQVYHAFNYDTFMDMTGERGSDIILGENVFDAAKVTDGSYFFTFYYKGKFKTVNYHGTLQIIRDR